MVPALNVIFVDHDHTQVLEGSEQRRSGSDGDWSAPAPQALPLFESLTRSQTAVQHGEVVAKARPKPCQDLVGEGDLGYEHQRLPALRKGSGHGAQVNLGLSATGDAVQ